jgi:hypothetical protein
VSARCVHTGTGTADGVIYTVDNSNIIGDEGWKQMLAPAGAPTS